MNVVAAGSGSVNDTRRRPATVAVAVCIGSYARVIFVMVMLKVGDVREYLSGHSSRQARREAERKNTNVSGSEKKHKRKGKRQ